MKSVVLFKCENVDAYISIYQSEKSKYVQFIISPLYLIKDITIKETKGLETEAVTEKQ